MTYDLSRIRVRGAEPPDIPDIIAKKVELDGLEIELPITSSRGCDGTTSRSVRLVCLRLCGAYTTFFGTLARFVLSLHLPSLE